MTTMIREVYEALKEAGASEEKAAAAAQAVLHSELQETLATKRDLKELELRLQAEVQAMLNRHLQIQLALMIAMTGIFAAIVKLT